MSKIPKINSQIHKPTLPEGVETFVSLLFKIYKQTVFAKFVNSCQYRSTDYWADDTFGDW